MHLSLNFQDYDNRQNIAELRVYGDFGQTKQK